MGFWRFVKMARIDLIESILDTLVKNTSKPYVTCKEAIDIVDVKVGMVWRDVFDIPNAIKLIDNEEPSEEEVTKLVNSSWWDKGTTHEEKIKTVHKTHDSHRAESFTAFKEIFKSRKVKPNDSVYDEFKGVLDPKEVSNIHEYRVDGRNDCDDKLENFIMLVIGLEILKEIL